MTEPDKANPGPVREDQHQLGLATTHDEWQVTGEPGPINGSDQRYPSYLYVFGSPQESARAQDGTTAEQRARYFISQVTGEGRQAWESGPFLAHRQVTETAWVNVDLAPADDTAQPEDQA